MDSKGLRFLKITKINHIFPIDNEIEHIPKRECRCKPQLKNIKGKLTWFHNPIEEECEITMTDFQVERFCTELFVNSYNKGR